MIGIVIVSHSRKIGEGVRDLAQQMVQDRVPIAVAAGLDDLTDPIGTDPIQVQAAIESVYSTDGVLVLMDLGSALLSAETALDFLTPEQRSNVFLCEAPLVEGTLAAAVQAMTGSSIMQVMAEARGALEAKRQQLIPVLPREASLTSPNAMPDLAAAETLRLNVPNALGLHARPLARLVEIVSHFRSEIQVAKSVDGKSANVRSINSLAALGARQGDELLFSAVGPDAEAALAAIQALADTNFGDTHIPTTEQAAADVRGVSPLVTLGVINGIPVSPGIAIGPAALLYPDLPIVEEWTVDDVVAEWARIQVAIAAALAEIKAIEESAQQQGVAEAAIFAAHRLMLQDPELLADLQQKILTERCNAEAAWQRAIARIVEPYEVLDDAYLRARAADVRDVGRRVLRRLANAVSPSLVFAQSVILVASDLHPSETVRLDTVHVLGLVTEAGGPTDHSAILARALGIPALTGVPDVLNLVRDGQLIGLDGATGQLWLAPTAEDAALLYQRRAEWQADQARAQPAGRQPAVTRDGKQIVIMANISGPQELDVALAAGAEGVGLFRTEFLFMGRTQPPSEESQLATYRAVAAKLHGRPLVIRTLDVGGDKLIPYLGMRPEANPFLGWRGIRYCLANPLFFKMHLRAILRVAAEYPVQIMFPMVSTLAEVRDAKALLRVARDELNQENLPCAATLETGIMIEVPSAVILADQLAREVDFFSIGTNDLTQYLMAADRGNAQVAALVNAFQPAVIRAMQSVVSAAHAAGIRVSICGELAGNPLATPLLVGLGLDQLSMHAPIIPQIKTRIRALEMKTARALVKQLLTVHSAAEIEKRLVDAS